MSTNQDAIDKALYELGVLEYGASADATDSADVLLDLNNMMAAWEVRDIDLNWFPQDTLTATLPVPKWAEKGVISNLAMDVAATFNVMPSQQLIKKAVDGMKAISNRSMNDKIQKADMTHLGNPGGRWDIGTDTY